jgi:predicted nucleic acid-binding protein
MIYLDSSYLVRLYFKDPGFEVVRQLAATDVVACAQHGRAEVIAALHRKLREGSLPNNLYHIVLQEFFDEIRAGGFAWLPLSPVVFERVQRVFGALPATIFLRAADAMHLAAAAESGLREIYSNDVVLLSAAPEFGLRGVNVIGTI